jgi:dolichol-phosphate mannosyltransferase
MKKKVSIVVPCFNEDLVLRELYSRLQGTVTILDNYDVEIIFVDDGSNDSTLEVLREMARDNANLRVVSFSRNFGHQVAVSAGIDLSTGDAIVLIDADLQDPPELIPSMVEKWSEGVDVVYGVRTKRKSESVFKKASAKYFYRLLRALSGTDIPADTGDFRLISRRVAEVLRSMPENDRFMRGMVSWAGFTQEGIPYERDGRFAGETKYTLRKMVRLAGDAILSFSIVPLRISVTLGLASSLLAFIGIAYAVFVRIFSNEWVEGWAFIVISVLFVGGVQLLSVGILGEYLGRLYLSSKSRPLYVVKEKLGF